MRPLLLRMQAFGPYKTTETVDFRELGSTKLFLIHGETGAGKTSILDAIVFALYGDTSGGERQAFQMRCESADPATLTEVEFDFALGERTYRMLRRPKQEIARRSGEGTVPKQGYAAMWETTEAAPGTEGDLLGAKIREVDEAVRERLGFSSEQFRQVVVLPQGKFRDLLAAGSDKREEILKQLFRTEECADLERRLRERARLVVEQRKELAVERRTRLEAAGAEDDAQLEALTEAAAASSAALGRDAAAAVQAADAAAKALSEAEKAAEAAGAVKEAEGRVARLTAEQPRIDELAATVERARRAEKVAPRAQACGQTAGEARAAEAALEDARRRRDEAVTQEAEATTALQREEALAPERAAAADEVRRLTELRQKVAAWQQAEQRRAEADQTLTAAAKELALAEQAVKDASVGHEAAGQAVAQAQTAAAELTSAEQRLEQARQRAGQCLKRDVAEKALAAAEAEREQAVAAFELARSAFEARREEHEVLEAAWRAGRAASLALDLADGAPCPVCGSTDHPAPARSGDEVDDAALDVARAGLEEARGLQDARRESCARAEATAAQARGQLESLLASLPEGSTTAQAEAEALECDGACRKLAQAVAAVPDADEVLAAAGEAVTAAEQRRAAAREGDRAAATGLAAAQARAGELGSAVPEELRSPAVLEQALGDAQAEADRREAALKAARDAYAAARERLVGAERDLKAAADAKDKAAAAEAAAGESFAEALALSEFETAEAFEAALMDERALAEADAAVRAHGTALSEAKGQLVQALTSVTDHPVTAALGDVRAQAEATAERSREAQRLHTAAEARLAGLKAARAVVDELDRACEEVAASYAVVGKLADVAAGQEGARVSFQRWVLGRYLDDVLVAASRRLAMMSKERYRLERQKETSDLRRASGLDLAVFDSWSNRSRPAVTLSGGESFLAALSLALGLAETVQEQSGGTRLETIFVDEGFGALDQSALDQAMDALAELRDSGRLVGVISHVPELRQVIDARLEVRGGPGGSSARFIVP